MEKAKVAFRSFLFTIKSKKPCSTKNSEVWNPSGKSLPMVSLITLGPAKPIKALGSAIFKSPSLANEAVTPHVVGSVINDMYGNL